MGDGDDTTHEPPEAHVRQSPLPGPWHVPQEASQGTHCREGVIERNQPARQE